MRLLYKILVYFHTFIGLGAMAGGLAAITNPTEPMGMTTEVLKYGPFHDFLIPGLFLFIILGIGNSICAYFAYKKIYYLAYFTGIIGFTMMMWIIIQCIILDDVVFLHILFFILGLIQCIIAFIFVYKKNLFPINIILKKDSN